MGATRTEVLRGLHPDRIEKVLVVLFLGLLCTRLFPAIAGGNALIPLILLASEAMVVLFVLFRRPTDAISRRPGDWAVGLTGTLLPLMAVAPQGGALVPTAAVVAIMLAGFVLQLSAKLTLRRSFGVVAANRGVKTGGPYAFIRHPMYAGYALTHIGFLLAGPVLWNVAIYGATFALAIRRILAEERVLGPDEAYQAMRAKVRYRLVPFLF